MKRSGSAGAARLSARLPKPQATAAAITSAKPSAVATPSSPPATSTSPPNATASPSTCEPAIRSRSSAAASTTVNSACACSTSDASPAGIPTSIPMNSSENFTTPIAIPTASTQRQRTAGIPPITSSGSAASA